MNPSFWRHVSPAFTLIELLVVIAIIAILAVVVVLTLNPAQLLAQSRDANRLSDLATINSALNLYNIDQAGAPGFSLGNASSVYLSLPDTSSSCVNLNLPTTSPSGINYACVVSTSSRKTDSSGWIPINFSLISSGSPLGSLPIDPTNQSSSGLYYTYYGTGTNYMITAVPESQKQKLALANNPPVPGYPDVMANGSSITISPFYNSSGLLGYWPLNEGTGTAAYDQSGNGNNGVWHGAASGTNGYYNISDHMGNYVGAWGNSQSPGTYAEVIASYTFPNNQATLIYWEKFNQAATTTGQRNMMFSTSTSPYGGNALFVNNPGGNTLALRTTFTDGSSL